MTSLRFTARMVRRHEARRIIERFSYSKADLHLLLAGRGGTNTHRRRELCTAEENAAFGLEQRRWLRQLQWEALSNAAEIPSSE